ncbi:MAG: EAL domain-containing protein [Treponema sp.]|nr:EAL domain-containing protein [Treponema sp.]
MYNILGEFCCLLIAIVFLVFIINSFYLRERRNFLFLLCNISLIFACVSDILSCYGIEYYEKCSYFFCVSTSTVYFLSLCLLPFLYCLYFYASISAVHKFSKFFHGTLFLFFGIYLFIVIANIWTGWLFSFVPGIGYVRGKLKYSTYEITFLMIIAIEIAVIRHRRSMSSRMFTVFVLYPIISAFVSLIQIFKPSWLLSGCSGTITMVLMYLAIQSDQIEIDYKSGLKTEQHLSRTLRKKLRPCTLSSISIENLGVLQETLGSTEVDKLIYNLVRSFRVNISGTLFRYGNQFLVLSAEGSISKVSEQILSSFKKYSYIPSSISGREFSFHFIGASLEIPNDAEDYDDALELLKGLMSKARKEKTCCVVRCNEAFINDFRRTKTIIKILERELNPQSTQYQVYFQPIISIEKNKFVYAEALSRLNGTELGDISPSEFIPIAENNGLIEKLGRINFEKVCEFISRNSDVVKAVSVNFSVYQMINPEIKDFVFSMIEKYKIKPENIIMEITESIFIDDFEIVRSRMEEFVKAGIIFYLDDFGTGFSNFANVIRLPFYTIKIDRSFVLMMERDEEILKLVKNLISTFKDSNLKILVEGVETERQDKLVREASVDYIQGFLYSKPLSMDSYLKLLREQK